MGNVILTVASKPRCPDKHRLWRIVFILPLDGTTRKGLHYRTTCGRGCSLKVWVVEAGLDPRDYSVESLRRTKALHILKGTGDLQTVRALLGHARIESTARYLGLKTKTDPIEVCRAFDI